MSEDFTAISLTALVVDGGTTATTEESVGFAMFKKNTAFAGFAARMQGVDRKYYVREKGENKSRCIEAPENFESEELCAEWLNVCFKEYLAQKRRYESKASARRKNAVILAVVFFFLFAGMFYSWPLWNVLIDVEADEHYKILGITDASSPAEIKKAYRQQIKRWHPDHNPQCTDHCRLMTMKIQRAHDVLLARGDHRFELANQYKKELLQLRSFVFFRIYTIAANAGGEISVLVQRMSTINLDASQEFKLRIACVIGAMLFFAAYEAFFVAGLDLVTILSFFAYCVSVVKVSAEAVAVSSLTKNAYVDCVREAVFFVAPVVTLHLGHMLFWDTTVSKAEEICHMVFGILYLLAFLYNFSPNLMDNLAMKKFSLPLWSVNGQSSRFSRNAFLLAQVGFLVNDLFVFTCRIPTIYRVVAYVLNFLYLSEFLLLPWEAPIRKRKGESKPPPPLFQAADEPNKKQRLPNASSSSAAAEEKGGASPTDLGFTKRKKRACVVAKTLAQDEIPLLAQLDSENVEWVDVAGNKYKMLLVTTAKDAFNQLKKRFQQVSLCYGSDMQSVVVCVSSAAAAGDKVDIVVTSTVKDPICTQLLAIEAGPGGMIPDKKVQKVFTADFAMSTYHSALKEKASLTMSQLFRRQVTKTSSSKARMSRTHWPSLAAGVALLLFSLVCAFSSPAERDATRMTKGLPAHQRVLLLARYTPFAPLSNVVNRLPAGLLLLRGTSFILFTTDVWELLH